MKNKRTYYQLLLDRSGSMSSCIEQTVDGVNQQILRIKEIAGRFPEQELYTSLTLFNHKISPSWDRINPEKLRELTFSDYAPGGRTALFDAIGMTINHLQQSIGEEAEQDEASIVIVIVTDGYENASTDFSHKQVASMIHDLEETGKWTFSYIGATLDAVEIAQHLNIRKSNAIMFDTLQSGKMFNRINDSLTAYLTNKNFGNIKNDFIDDQHEDKD